MVPGDWSMRPVFICGYPKSGTTLLLALLDRHPELLVFPEETRFFQQIVGYPQRHDPEYLLNQTSIKLFEQDEFEMTSGFRDYSQIDFAQFAEIFRNLWETSFTSQPSILEIIMQSYGQATGQMSARCWVEKTPLNEKYLKKAQAWWPDLHAIYILRDPRDNYCSYRKQRLMRFESRRQQGLTDVSDPPQRKIPSPLTLESFIANWLESVNLWQQFINQNPNSLLIRYKDLVQAPHREMSRIAEFLGVGWDDILLKPTRNGTPWSGNSMYNSQFTGISTASLGRYEELMTEEEIRVLESWLQPVMKFYGWQIGDPVIALSALLRGLVTTPGVKPSQRLKLVIEQLRYRIPSGRRSLIR